MLGTLLDAVELMRPELFKGLYPVMHRFQLLRFQVVHALFALLDHRDHADLAQHAQVFRDSRLRKSQRCDQRSNSQGPALPSNSTICRRRGSAMALNTSAVVGARGMLLLYSHVGMCQAKAEWRTGDVLLPRLNDCKIGVEWRGT